MLNIERLFNLWYIKAAFGIILALFAPVHTSVIIVFIMILLDAVSGIACAVKAKRFNSKTLKKSLKKTMLYALCILTIRLMEVGVFEGGGMVILTQVVSGFLIITEATSILENLTILGLPLPTNFLSILFKQIRIGALEELIAKSQQEKREISDIEDILYYQVSTIKSESMRKLLEIKIETWIEKAKELISYFDGLENEDNDLTYYKIAGIIQSASNEMSKEWVDEGISKECIEKFNEWHTPRIANWLIDVREVCYRIIPPQKKKEELMKKLTILLYRTVLDAQKGEKGLCESCMVTNK